MSGQERQVTLPPGAPRPVRHRTVIATGARLAVAEIGLADAPAMVLAHGAGSSARFVASAFARPVLAAGWRLVTYDLRGHGASSAAPGRPEHHLDVHAADLAAVVASTDGEVDVVGGVSLGAHAAVRAMSLLAPVRVIACLPAWTGRTTPGQGPHAAIAAEVSFAGVTGLIGRIREDRRLPTWLWHALVTDLPRHDPDSLAAALTALDGAGGPDEQELGAFTCPTAVVGWSGDPGHPIEVAERWARLLPRASLVTIRLGDLDDGPERLGAAAVRAIGMLCGVEVGR